MCVLCVPLVEMSDCQWKLLRRNAARRAGGNFCVANLYLRAQKAAIGPRRAPHAGNTHFPHMKLSDIKPSFARSVTAFSPLRSDAVMFSSAPTAALILTSIALSPTHRKCCCSSWVSQKRLIAPTSLKFGWMKKLLHLILKFINCKIDAIKITK